MTRRQLLARCGVVGAGLAVAGAVPLPAGRASAGVHIPSEVASEAMHRLARDTIAGLAVFAVPGQDDYSTAQGQTSATPGAIDAEADGLLLQALDDFLPFPDGYVRTLAAALRTGVDDAPLPDDLRRRLNRLLELGGPAAATLDEALARVLANDAAVPLSLLIALMLNFEATSIDPTAVAGPFAASPFANLPAASKAEVFRRLEDAQSELVALLDRHAPEPLQGSISGLVQYIGGTLLEFAAFTPYTEYGVFDHASLRATARPVGWDLAHYMPGRTAPADGWNEFVGYYQGRRSAGPTPGYQVR